MGNQSTVNRRFSHPEKPEVFVELPAVWLGRHVMIRDQAAQAAAQYKSDVLSEAAIALALAEKVQGIVGLEGSDPRQWDVTAVPLPELLWLMSVVLSDFAEALRVPKAS